MENELIKDNETKNFKGLKLLGIISCFGTIFIYLYFLLDYLKIMSMEGGGFIIPILGIPLLFLLSFLYCVIAILKRKKLDRPGRIILYLNLIIIFSFLYLYLKDISFFSIIFFKIFKKFINIY